MSKLDALRSQLRHDEEWQEPSPPPPIGKVAVVAIILIAAIAGAAELHLLPTFSADDVASILFQRG